MKTELTSGNRAISRIGVIVIVAMLGMMAMVVLPALAMAKAKSTGIKCVNNLKHVGLGIRIAETDRPRDWSWWNASTNARSDAGRDDANQAWRHFAALSNDVPDPRVFWCPTDTERVAAGSYTNRPGMNAGDVLSGNQQVSYFVGLGFASDDPSSIMSGDRNLTTNGVAVGPSTRLIRSANWTVGWTDDGHQNVGNLLLGDGSVQQIMTPTLARAVMAMTNPGPRTNVWLVP